MDLDDQELEATKKLNGTGKEEIKVRRVCKNKRRIYSKIYKLWI